MSRGFKSAEPAHKPTSEERHARQRGYASVIKELKRVSDKNANIRTWMDRPPYQAREVYQRYEDEQRRTDSNS